MFKLFATLLVASAAVMASPVHVRNVADVYDPKITSPVAAQVWGVGSTQVVSWDLTSIPESEYSKTGYLLLGYLENNSENLDISEWFSCLDNVFLLTMFICRASSCYRL